MYVIIIIQYLTQLIWKHYHLSLWFTTLRQTFHTGETKVARASLLSVVAHCLSSETHYSRGDKNFRQYVATKASLLLVTASVQTKDYFCCLCLYRAQHCTSCFALLLIYSLSRPPLSSLFLLIHAIYVVCGRLRYFLSAMPSVNTYFAGYSFATPAKCSSTCTMLIHIYLIS